MPKFYCDYCDTYLTHDSPSVRKTHCSGRKHKENVKDYYQKWMEEQAQSLIDKTTAAFQQGKIPPTPFSAPPPAGAMIPPPPSIRKFGALWDWGQGPLELYCLCSQLGKKRSFSLKPSHLELVLLGVRSFV